MQTELKLFAKNDYRLRALTIDSKEYFVAIDIANMLNYKNTDQAIRTHCKKSFIYPLKVKGQVRRAKLIPESDVWRLIIKSTKPEADQIENWIMEEVLPNIRKTGTYSIQQDSYMIKDPIERAKAWIVEEQVRVTLEHENLAKTKQIARDKPKVEFATQVTKAINSINIGSYAKALSDQYNIKIGQNKLFEYMRNNNILIKSGRRKNDPIQKYINNNYLIVSESKVATPKGIRVTKTTLITGEGQLGLANQIINYFKG